MSEFQVDVRRKESGSTNGLQLKKPLIIAAAVGVGFAAIAGIINIVGGGGTVTTSAQLEQALGDDYAALIQRSKETEGLQKASRVYINSAGTDDVITLFEQLALEAEVLERLPSRATLREYRHESERTEAVEEAAGRALRALASNAPQNTPLKAVMRHIIVDAVDRKNLNMFARIQALNGIEGLQIDEIGTIPLVSAIRSNLSTRDDIRAAFDRVDAALRHEEIAHGTYAARDAFVAAIQAIEHGNGASPDYVNWSPDVEPSDYNVLVFDTAPGITELHATVLAPSVGFGRSENVIISTALDDQVVWMPNLQDRWLNVDIDLEWTCNGETFTEQLRSNFTTSSAFVLDCN